MLERWVGRDVSTFQEGVDLVERCACNDNDLITNDLILRVALEAAHDPHLATALDDLILFRGRRIMSAILAQAADRGEIPADRDWTLIADTTSALGLLRIGAGQTVDADFIREVIDTLVLPSVHAPWSASKPKQRKRNTTKAKP